MKFKYLIFFIFLSIITFSCNENKSNKYEKEVYKEPLIRVNKILVDKDSDRINKYAERRGWNLSVSNTGLYYEIIKKTENSKDSIRKGDVISIKYDVSLLDGTKCYSSDSSGIKTFIFGNGEVENGLEEGLKMMYNGDKARLILLPHLAHGLLGDGNKIPPRSIIIYNVEITNIN